MTGLLANRRGVDDFITLSGTGNNTTALTVYTFPALALGAAHAARHNIFWIMARAATGRTITSVTCGGSAAAAISLGGGILVEAANGSSAYIAAYQLNTSALGLTEDLLVTWSGAMSLCSVHAHRAIVGAGGLSSITPVTTERVTNTSPAGSTPILSGLLDIAANATLVAASAGNNCGGVYTSDFGLWRNDGLLGTSSHGFCAARRAVAKAESQSRYGFKLSGAAGTSCAMAGAVFA